MTQTESLESRGLAPLIEAVRGIVAESGAVLSERAIADQLQVKRHRLRRALEALRATGELEPSRIGRRPAAEFRIGSDLAGSTNPIEIIELRNVLEPPLARFAAVRASPAEIERIGRAAQTPEGAEPGSVDLAFHRAVAAGARNSLAAELYALLRHVATDARLRFGDADARRRCPNRIGERDAEHQAIARAIAARDPDAAEQAMRAHLGAVQRQILARLGPAFGHG